MKKLIIFIFVFSVTKLIGQGDNKNSFEPQPYKNFNIEYKWTLFITDDSSYKATRFIDQNGFFYFKIGFVNSSEVDDDFFTLNKIENDVLIGESDVVNFKSGIPIYKFLEGIDTLYSYSLQKKQYNAAPDTQIIKGVYYFPWDLTEDIKLSYLIKQFKQPKILESKDTIIRIVEPDENLNICRNYNLIEVSFNENIKKIKKISGISHNEAGFFITKTDSALLEDKDVKKIRLRLNKILSSSFECFRPGNPVLLECLKNQQYFQFIFSDYCLDIKKELLSDASLYYLIGFNSRKYF